MSDSNALFKQELRKLLESHLTLAHPIFLELLDPKRKNIELLRKVTLQGYQLTKHFLDYVEHLYFHCPSPKFKRALLINVYEEETGRLSKTDNHVVLMQNFIQICIYQLPNWSSAKASAPASTATLPFSKTTGPRQPGWTAICDHVA